MIKFLILFSFILVCFQESIFAQTDSTFYKDKFRSKKCTSAQAKYVSIVSTDANGQSTREVKHIKGNVTLEKELNTGEPIGIWHDRKDRIWDFDFKVNYSDTACGEKISIGEKPFNNNDAMHYEAPLLEPDQGDILKFLGSHVIYQSFARNNDISGKVISRFVITSTGTIENITVLKSVHVSLDKEVVRVIRQLKLISPPKIDGKPVSVCASLPVVFIIQK